MHALAGENLIRTEVIAGVVFLLIDSMLLTAARLQFRRGRIMQDHA